MAKEKKSSDKTTSKKTATKKSAASRTAAPKGSGAEEIVTAAPVFPPEVLKAQPSTVELYEEIRRRAYEFFCERGGQHGSHEADWHRAESEVRSRYH
jgi:hypothetical protein